MILVICGTRAGFQLLLVLEIDSKSRNGGIIGTRASVVADFGMRTLLSLLLNDFTVF